jgi:transcriptional regulator with XRE-family HTH domain
MFLERRKNNIKGAMTAKKMTQKRMAKRLGLSESYITRLLNGTRYNKKFENFIYFDLNVDYRNLL